MLFPTREGELAVEFDTAVARALAEGEEAEVKETLTFTIVERDPDTDEILDKVECTAYKPNEGQIVILMADVMGRRATFVDKIAGTIDFFTDILDQPSKDYVVGRLLDPDDPLGLTELQPIINHIVEEWGGRPTKQPTDFSPSRKPGGQRSTRHTSKSTSSRSRSTAS